ncbi:MAG: bifunctional pyr operon transcriptional regulator/uracil phosphoribosyltransferase PyrR [Pseudomonadota bacterium]
MNTTELDVHGYLDALTEGARRWCADQGGDNPLIVGIHTGGAWVAEALHHRLAVTEPLSTLDISFYRDDFTRIGVHPQVKPSNLPMTVEDRHILLVDDVLQTGRTVRAALNEIFDYGRPASVTLAVLVDRPGRELPIAAAIAGARLDLAAEEQVTLDGPDPLALSLHDLNREESPA